MRLGAGNYIQEKGYFRNMQGGPGEGGVEDRQDYDVSVEADIGDNVDLFLRSSGEQRTSNFMIWQAAYAELVFLEEAWPDVDRRHLWRAIEEYARRDRRYGGAVDAPVT